jgi:hypothetical protein
LGTTKSTLELCRFIGDLLWIKRKFATRGAALGLHGWAGKSMGPVGQVGPFFDGLDGKRLVSCQRGW